MDYRVECLTETSKVLFAGLTEEDAMARAEAERVKPLWSRIVIKSETSGAVVAAYHGAGPVEGGAR